MTMSISISKQINPENFKQRKEDNETFFYQATSFNFLDDHYGFRPGKVHMFVGPTGGGKSSLVRTILNKMCSSHKILCLTTEESVDDLETTMAYAKEKINHDNFFVVEENHILEITKSTKDYVGYVKQLEWELEIHICL
jgi:ABC-type Mn2+/Zn2+ transport system ATPase subunit